MTISFRNFPSSEKFSIMLCMCACLVMANSFQPHGWAFNPLQAPLSIGFSRQEYWNGLSFPPPGDLPDSGIKLASFTYPVLSRKILYQMCHLEIDWRPCLSVLTFLLFPWRFTLILKNLILNFFFQFSLMIFIIFLSQQ